MKKAVIVVGSHYVGKSKTIREHLKPKLGIGKDDHIFHRNNQTGYILSQSLEEANRSIDNVIKAYGHYSLLVLAARPAEDTPSNLKEAISKLRSAGYRVSEVAIAKSDDDTYYNNKADEILSHLDN